jgi:signal peptidase I
MKLATALSSASRLVDALLVLLVAGVLGCVALTSLGPRLGHPSIVIEGGSMQPTIPIGSLAVLDPGIPRDLRVGDVVTFQAGNGTVVTHRVVRLATLPDGAYVGTKGDANAEPDPVVTPQTAILGRVAWTVPAAGYLVRLLATPIGFLAVFLVGASLAVLALLLEDLAELCRHGLRRPAPWVAG